jgi:hypothetical protein
MDIRNTTTTATVAVADAVRRRIQGRIRAPGAVTHAQAHVHTHTPNPTQANRYIRRKAPSPHSCVRKEGSSDRSVVRQLVIRNVRIVLVHVLFVLGD